MVGTDNLDWVKSPSIVIGLAVIAVLLIDHYRDNADAYNYKLGLTGGPSCIQSARGTPLEPGKQKLHGDEWTAFPQTDVRYQLRDKLDRILQACTAVDCTAELGRDIQKLGFQYFEYRTNHFIEQYKMYGEAGLALYKSRYANLDDRAVISGLRRAVARERFDISKLSGMKQAAAIVLLSNDAPELEPCRTETTEE